MIEFFIKALTKRLCEAPNVTQWIHIVKNRRTNDERSDMSEKEFLLTKATSIKTYNQYLITHEGEVLENMAAWGGKKHFWEIIEVPPVHPLTQLQYKFQVDFKKIRDFFYHQDFEIVLDCLDPKSVGCHPAISPPP